MRMTEQEYEAFRARQAVDVAETTVRKALRQVHRLPAPSEQSEQEMVIQWACIMQGQYPELEWLHHIPNGGQRDPATANMLKAAGVKRGVPDLCLPVPMPRPDGGDWHGLYIEVKRADRSNHATPEQKRWLDHLRSAGYMVSVCYGAEEAIRTIEHYIGGGRNGTGDRDGKGGHRRD